MRDLTNNEMELVGGGLLSVSTGDVNALNGISFGNGNEIASGNSVTASGNGSGNLSGNTADIAATVDAALSAAGL